MKYKIRFKDQEVEIESSQPQTALNEVFFGKEPLLDIPKHTVTIQNSKGDIWMQNLHFSYFTHAGTFMDNILEDDKNGCEMVKRR